MAEWIYKFRISPNLSSTDESAQHIIHQAHSSTILQQSSSTVVQTYTVFPTLIQGVNCVTADSNGISRNKALWDACLHWGNLRQIQDGFSILYGAPMNKKQSC